MADFSKPQVAPPRTLEGEPPPARGLTQSLSCPRYYPSLTSRPYDTRKVSSNPQLHVRSDSSGSIPTLKPTLSLSFAGVHHLPPIVHVRQPSSHRHAPPFSWWALHAHTLVFHQGGGFQTSVENSSSTGNGGSETTEPNSIPQDFLDSIQLSSALSIGPPFLGESVLVPYLRRRKGPSRLS
jgi:hypothetical protein